MATVVITGVSSFIGCQLAAFFNDTHAVLGTVTGDVARYEGIKRERLEFLASESIAVEKLDITETGELTHFAEKHKPDLWIHHAGYASRYSSFDFDIQKGFAVNVVPLYTLIPVLKKIRCRGIVCTGTNAEYGDDAKPNREADSCYPSLPYGLSKLAQTIALSQLSRRFAFPARVVRVYNPFGRFDEPDKLIAYAVAKLKKGEKVDLSPCLQKRDFIYIQDLLRLYGAVLGDLDKGGFEIYNGCSGSPVALRDLLSALCRQLGRPAELLDFTARTLRPDESMFSCGSTEKITSVLGFAHTYDLHRGVGDYLKSLEEGCLL